jgi:uncharacterized protein
MPGKTYSTEYTVFTVLIGAVTPSTFTSLFTNSTSTMKSQNLKNLVLGTILLALASSLSAQDSLTVRAATDAYFRGEPKLTISILEGDTTLTNSRSRMVYLLNTATALQALGEYAKSNERFDEAWKMIEADTVKLGGMKDLNKFMNPRKTVYMGESIEQIYIHVYKVENFLALGQPDGAKGELGRMKARIEKIRANYDSINAYTGEKLFHLLGGIVMEVDNQPEEALKMYKAAYNMLLTEGDSLNPAAIPIQLKLDLVRLSQGEERAGFEKAFNLKATAPDPKKGAVIVFWASGQVPQKKPYRMNLMLGPESMNQANKDINAGLNSSAPAKKASMVGGLAKMAKSAASADKAELFKAVDRNNGEEYPFALGAGMKVVSSMISDGKDIQLPYAGFGESKPTYNQGKAVGTSEFSVLESPGQQMPVALRDRKLKEINGMMGAYLAKTAGKDQAKQQLTKLAGKMPGGQKLAEKASDKIMDKAMGESEKPDLRQWNTLPHTFYYTRVTLPKGNQKLNVEMTSETGEKLTATRDVVVGDKTAVVILGSTN